MRNRGRLLALPALAAAAGLAWTGVGGVSVEARGQTPPPVLIKRAHAGAHRPSLTDPIFILALGSDVGAPRYRRGGKVERGRADSIHIIAINPQQKAATIIGIPRDSYVPIPGHGQNKINAAMSSGGPDLMVRTVEALVRRGQANFEFDYYMLGGFDDLEDMVNELGAIPVNVPYAMNDKASGARFRKGLQALDGREALALSRNRKDARRGDFGRSENQGLVLLGALTKARSEVARNPARTLAFLRIIFRHTRTDIPLGEAFRLGLVALQISPTKVKNLVVPGTTGPSPAGSSVFLTQPATDRLLADVAEDGLLS